MLRPTGGVRVDPLRCVRRFGPAPRCEVCAHHCPETAISFDGRTPVVDAKTCTSCRICEASCPADALRGDERDLGLLASELAQAPSPVLGCRIDGVQAHAHTGCLGFLELEALLAFALALPQGVALNLTRCGQCRNAPVADRLEAMRSGVRALPGDPATDRVRIVRRPDDLGYQDANLSRRGFFGTLGRRSAGVAAKAVPAPGEYAAPEAAHKTLPARRLLLLRGLATLAREQREALEEALFPQLRFRPSCNHCTGCDGICPTGAITTSTADPPRPLFLRALCTGCGACAVFCSEEGIALTPAAAIRLDTLMPAD